MIKNNTATSKTKYIVIYLMLSFLLPLISIGQENETADKKLRNQIGINLYSFTNPPDGLINYKNNIAFHNYINGITYKRLVNKSALRFSIDYYKIIDIPDGNTICFDCNIYQSSYNGGVFKFGYEKRFFRGKLQPFIGADGVLMYGRTIALRKQGEVEYFKYLDLISKGVGIGSVLGGNYRLHELFSVSGELDVYYMNYQYKNSNREASLAEKTAYSYSPFFVALKLEFNYYF